MKKISIITGNGKTAAAIGLKRLLTKNNTKWIVLDYSGRLSLVLEGLPNNELNHNLVTWLDLANRSSPRGVFQLWSSPHLAGSLFSALQQIRSISGFPIHDNVLHWLTEIGIEASKNGKVSLGTLQHCLTEPGLYSWLRDRCPKSEQIESVQKMLSWCLSFSSVYCFSEGSVGKNNNSFKISRKKITWFEMLSEHFECAERRILSTLLMNFIRFLLLEVVLPEVKNNEHNISIIHGFPPFFETSKIPGWIRETGKFVDHIYIQNLRPDMKPKNAFLCWLNHASEIWVTPLLKNLTPAYHNQWLSEEECRLVNNLKKDQLFLKDRRKEKHLVAKVTETGILPVTHRYRRSSSPSGTYLFPFHVHMHTEKAPAQDLYKQVYTNESLQMAWLKTRKGKKATHGVDGVSIAAFDADKDNHIATLMSELRNRTYRPRPIKRHRIPKSDGTSREIGIFCIRDKVVQLSCLSVIEPLFDPEFSNFSFAFRPRRNAHQAVALTSSYVNDGFKWVVTADIQKCFDTIDRQLLLQLVEKKVNDRDILTLIGNWLFIDVIDFLEIIPVLSGVPQGSALSPFLANIYLDPLDKYLEKSGCFFVRYADDILIFAENELHAQNVLGRMEIFLKKELHMALKPAKTKYKSVVEGFDFLGFTFQGKTIRIKTQKIVKIIATLKERIKLLGKSDDLQMVFSSLQNLNSFIRGVRNYFTLPLADFTEEQLEQLDHEVEVFGKKYLPSKLRDDSIWQAREHFFIPDTKKDQNIVNDINNRRVVSAAYHQESFGETAGVAYQAAVIPVPVEKIQNTQITITEKEEEPSIVVTDDSQIHIFKHGSLLSCDNEFLILKKKRKEIWQRRLSECSALFFQGKGNFITTKLHLTLNNYNVPLFLLSATGEIVSVTGMQSGTDKAHLRTLQATRGSDTSIVSAGLAMLAAKTANQSSLLKYFSKYRKRKAPDLAEKLCKAADAVSVYADSIRKLDPGTAMIRRTAMGLEGKAASIYWQALTALTPDYLEFTNRKTKGATDVINQCLNYAYALLYGEVWRKVYGFGLDPCFGIMHSSVRDMGSLVFDLIEEFRVPFADRVVISLLGRGFKPEVKKDGRLTLRTRKTLLAGFLKRWNKKMSWRSQNISPQEILHSQTGAIVAMFQEDKPYKPFRMKW